MSEQEATKPPREWKHAPLHAAIDDTIDRLQRVRTKMRRACSATTRDDQVDHALDVNDDVGRLGQDVATIAQLYSTLDPLDDPPEAA